MAFGKVKWFNDTRGFGMIERGEGEEVFVHYSAIQSGHQATASSSRKTLREGDSVRFDIYVGEQGFNARNVSKV